MINIKWYNIYEGDYPIFFYLPKYFFTSKNLNVKKALYFLKNYFLLEWLGDFRLDEKKIPLFLGRINISINSNKELIINKELKENELLFTTKIDTIINYLSLNIKGNFQKSKSIDLVEEFTFPVFLLNNNAKILLTINTPIIQELKEDKQNIPEQLNIYNFQKNTHNIELKTNAKIKNLKLQKNILDLKNLININENLYFFDIYIIYKTAFNVYTKFYKSLIKALDKDGNLELNTLNSMGLTFLYFKQLP